MMVSASQPAVSANTGESGGSGERLPAVEVGPLLPDYRSTHTEADMNAIEQYLADNGYGSVEDWARDSDYVQTPDGTWTYDDGGHVYEIDIESALETALEASGDLAKYLHT